MIPGYAVGPGDVCLYKNGPDGPEHRQIREPLPRGAEGVQGVMVNGGPRRSHPLATATAHTCTCTVQGLQRPLLSWLLGSFVKLGESVFAEGSSAARFLPLFQLSVFKEWPLATKWTIMDSPVEQQ